MSGDADFDTAEITTDGMPARPIDAPIPAASVEFGALSHLGKVRLNNEDHFLTACSRRLIDVANTNLPGDSFPSRYEEDAYLMIVADGMGGSASGEHASFLAIVQAVRLALAGCDWPAPPGGHKGEVEARLQGTFAEVDRKLMDESRSNRAYAGMGTTLIVCYSVGDRLLIAHAGDSRAYLLRDGELDRLTADHTLAQMLADAGQIEASEVADHPKRHILTNYLGGPSRGVTATIGQVELRDGDAVMLCTDGLTEMVSDAEIRRLLQANPDPKAACESLIRQALAAGGSDNVTAVVARYRVAPAIHES